MKHDQKEGIAIMPLITQITFKARLSFEILQKWKQPVISCESGEKENTKTTLHYACPVFLTMGHMKTFIFQGYLKRRNYLLGGRMDCSLIE